VSREASEYYQLVTGIKYSLCDAERDIADYFFCLLDILRFFAYCNCSLYSVIHHYIQNYQIMLTVLSFVDLMLSLRCYSVPYLNSVSNFKRSTGR